MGIMSILFGNATDINAVSSLMKIISFTDPKTGNKVYTTYYTKLQDNKSFTTEYGSAKVEK